MGVEGHPRLSSGDFEGGFRINAIAVCVVAVTVMMRLCFQVFISEWILAGVMQFLAIPVNTR